MKKFKFLLIFACMLLTSCYNENNVIDPAEIIHNNNVKFIGTTWLSDSMTIKFIDESHARVATNYSDAEFVSCNMGYITNMSSIDFMMENADPNSDWAISAKDGKIISDDEICITFEFIKKKTITEHKETFKKQ